jgi:hypothetical protein
MTELQRIEVRPERAWTHMQAIARLAAEEHWTRGDGAMAALYLACLALADDHPAVLTPAFAKRVTRAWDYIVLDAMEPTDPQ